MSVSRPPVNSVVVVVPGWRLAEAPAAGSSNP